MGMHATAYFREREEDEREREMVEARDDVVTEILDCKDWAWAGEKIGGLTAVRGYAIFAPPDHEDNPDEFTEHWWCVDGAGKIVDATGLDVAAKKLVPLNSRDEPGEVCMEYESMWCSWGGSDAELFQGDASKVCPWCEVRFALQSLGQQRRCLPDVRSWLYRLWLDNQRLRSEVDALKLEFAKMLPAKRKARLKS